MIKLVSTKVSGGEWNIKFFDGFFGNQIFYILAAMLNSDKFSELRAREDVNREHLAVRMGLSSSAIQNVETDPEHNPAIKLIQKYVKYFNVKYEDLLNMEGVTLGDAI